MKLRTGPWFLFSILIFGDIFLIYLQAKISLIIFTGVMFAIWWLFEAMEDLTGGKSSGSGKDRKFGG